MVDLTNGGKMSGACIVGLDESKNVQVYAQSPGFPAVTKAQVESFLGNMDNPNVFGATGITIGDKKFVAVGPNPGIALRGKKGQGGCCVAKTANALVIGIYEEGVQPGDTNNVVENMADYLKGVGV